MSQPQDRRSWPQYRDCPTDMCAALDRHTSACLASLHGQTTPDGQRLYTLEQARPLIKRERCDFEGHDLERVILQRVASGKVVIDRWHCTNGCGVDVILRYPEEGV